MHRALTLLLLVALAASPCSAKQKGWGVLKGGFRILTDAHFIDANTGFVVGLATVIRTTDGGQTWKQASLPKDFSLMTIFSGIMFSSPTNGCMTYEDSILYTHDGGLTWQRAALDAPAPVSRFIFPNAQSGFATGGSSNGGSAFFVTKDGGASWHHVNAPGDTSTTFWGADFRDLDHGMLISAHGDPLCYDLWRTSDACQHWERITPNVIDSCSHDLSAVTHVSGSTWVIGGNSIQRSTDDGTTWTKVSILPRPNIISFADSLTGYAGGNLKGVIYKTWDAGATWKETAIVADSPATINAIAAPTPLVAYALGSYNPTNYHDDVIFRTEDGGGISGIADAIPIDPDVAQLFPNPATSTATVVVEPAPRRRVFVVMDMLGRIARQETLEADAPLLRFNVSDLPPGMYYARIADHTLRFGVVR